MQGNEEHQDIPENIPEDSLIDILAAVRSRTSSTETIIVHEAQQTNQRQVQRKKIQKMKTKLKKLKTKIIRKRNKKQI